MTSYGLNVIMTDMLGVAETKQRFAELVERVLRGERFVVTRRGRPVAALVPAGDAALRDVAPPVGLAAFAGALSEWDDLERVMAEVVAARQRAGQRPAPELA